MKKLVIVESPSKAKTIEKYLGRGYKVTASMGHVMDLPKSVLGVDIEHDFEPRYMPMREKKDLIQELTGLAQDADQVFLAFQAQAAVTDPVGQDHAPGGEAHAALGIGKEPGEDASRCACKQDGGAESALGVAGGFAHVELAVCI